jgi:hypothetical protein
MATELVAVATVAGRPIPLAWVEERLAELRRGRLGRQLPPDGAGEAERLRRWVVQELVNRQVLLHEAHHAGLLRADPDGNEPHPDRRPELPAAVLHQLYQDATADVAVPEAEVRSYYERNVDLYRRPETRTIRYRINDSKGAAGTALVPALDGSAGESPDGARCGVMPLRRGELVGALEDAVFAAQTGALIGPVAFGDGWMVARVESIVAETTVPFDVAHDEIEADLVQAARSRAFDDWIASRVAVLALIEPAYEHPGHPVHGMPHHRH